MQTAVDGDGVNNVDRKIEKAVEVFVIIYRGGKGEIVSAFI